MQNSNIGGNPQAPTLGLLHPHSTADSRMRLIYEKVNARREAMQREKKVSEKVAQGPPPDSQKSSSLTVNSKSTKL